MDEQRLQQRGIGRKEANECVRLIEATASVLDLNSCAAFWDSIREFMAEIVPADPAEQLAADAMTAEEARDFSREEMPFGKFKGTPIRDCDLQYLDWLVGELESFMARLARYMRSEGVQEELSQSLNQMDREDWP